MTKETFRGRDWRGVLHKLLDLVFDADKEYELTIKEKKKKRSKDANAYFWEFLDQLAVKLNIDKFRIYRELIHDIGGVSEIVCVKTEAVKRLTEGWEHNGIGWFTEQEESRIPACTNVILYYGSSTYDTAQMSRLIDRLIFECSQVGIDTTDLRTKALLEVQNDPKQI